MNAWQMLQQIRYKLDALTWGEGANEPVLGGGAIITAGLPSEYIDHMGSPFVVLNVGGGQVHDEEAELIPDQQFSLSIVMHSQDSHGVLTLIGGNRPSGPGSSENRGLLEIEEVVINEVEQVMGIGGTTIRMVSAYDAAADQLDNGVYFGARTYTLSCACTRFRYYHPPRNLSISGTTLSWALPPDRYDRYNIVVRESASSTPPASVTDGTPVALGSLLATSVDVGAGSGRSWAVFAGYDETGSSSAERYSLQEPGTTLVE